MCVFTAKSSYNFELRGQLNAEHCERIGLVTPCYESFYSLIGQFGASALSSVLCKEINMILVVAGAGYCQA